MPSDADALDGVALAVEMSSEGVLRLIVVVNSSDRHEVGSGGHSHVIIKHVVCLIVLGGSFSIIEIRA